MFEIIYKIYNNYSLEKHQCHWCFLFLSNLFSSLKIRHIVHTQHCKYVHIKYVQTLMLMTDADYAQWNKHDKKCAKLVSTYLKNWLSGII